MEGAFGRRARAFVAALPAELARLSRQWELELGLPFPELSYHYVTAATRRGRPVVLKLGVPTPDLACEIEALRRFDGRGAVRLLDAEPETGALLLERLHPGTLLKELGELEALEVAAGLMPALWCAAPDPHPFPTLERWAEGFVRLRARFAGGTGPLPAAAVSRAESLFAELCASAQRRVLLHGDLHHWNVLRAEREPWLAIDPHGVVGDRAYEVGALLRNGFRLSSDPERLLAKGAPLLSERLEIDRDRLLCWTFAHCVLSAVWSLEDRESPGTAAAALRCAELTATLLAR
jgi:streptomycin 6-kinase